MNNMIEGLLSYLGGNNTSKAGIKLTLVVRYFNTNEIKKKSHLHMSNKLKLYYFL